MYVKLNFSDLQIEMLCQHDDYIMQVLARHAHAKARAKANPQPKSHRCNHQHRVAASCDNGLQENQSEKAPINPEAEAVGLGERDYNAGTVLKLVEEEGYKLWPDFALNSDSEATRKKS